MAVWPSTMKEKSCGAVGWPANKYFLYTFSDDWMGGPLQMSRLHLITFVTTTIKW